MLRGGKLVVDCKGWVKGRSGESWRYDEGWVKGDRKEMSGLVCMRDDGYRDGDGVS